MQETGLESQRMGRREIYDSILHGRLESVHVSAQETTIECREYQCKTKANVIVLANRMLIIKQGEKEKKISAVGLISGRVCPSLVYAALAITGV